MSNNWTKGTTAVLGAVMVALFAGCWSEPTVITPPEITILGSGGGQVTPKGATFQFEEWGVAHVPAGAVATPQDVNCELQRPTDVELAPGEVMRLDCNPHGLAFPDADPMRLTINIDALPKEVRAAMSKLEPGQPLLVVYMDDPGDARVPAVAYVSPDGRSVALRVTHFSTYSLRMIDDLLDPAGIQTAPLDAEHGGDGEGAFIAWVNEVDPDAIFSRGGSPVACLLAKEGLRDEGCRRAQWELILTELLVQGWLHDEAFFDETVGTSLAGIDDAESVVDFTGASVTAVSFSKTARKLMRDNVYHWPQKATLRNVHLRLLRALDKADSLISKSFLMARSLLTLLASTAVAQGETVDRIEAVDGMLLLDGALALGTSTASCADPKRWKPTQLAGDRAFRQAWCTVRSDVAAAQDGALDAVVMHLVKTAKKTGLVADLSQYTGEVAAQWVLKRAFGVTPVSLALSVTASLLVEAVIDTTKLTDNQQQRALLTTYLVGAEHGNSDAWLKEPRRTDDGYRLDGNRLEVAAYARRFVHLLAEEYHTTADVGLLAKAAFFLYDLFEDEFCVDDAGDRLVPADECEGDSFGERELRAWYALKRAEESLETVQAIRGNLLHGAFGDLYDEPPTWGPIPSEEIRMPVDGMLVETCETPVDSGSTYFDGTCSSQFTVVFKGRYEGYAAMRGKGSGCHPGYDLPVPRGTTVYAGVHGEVDARIPRNAKTGYNGGWGGLVVIRNTTLYGEPVYIAYAHLDDVLVSPGDIVTPDTVIGRSGNTGHSFGAHLHWQADRDTVGSLGHQSFMSPYFPAQGTEDPSKCNVDDYSLDVLDLFVKRIQDKDVSSL